MRISLKTVTLSAAALAASLALAPQTVRAEGADPAAGQIETFDSALLSTMKEGSSLGMRGRMHRLQPAVEHAFNLPAMAQYTVGPAWTKFSDADKAAVIEAFTRYSVANYASNFSSYSGDVFTVDPKVDERGPDKLVHTRLVPAHHAPVDIVYRMRQSGGTWKIIDIFYQGSISQLTTRRSDFAATVASGGASALVAHLNALTEKLMK
jgi:phospholipid transport system substrate-binding protein